MPGSIPSSSCAPSHCPTATIAVVVVVNDTPSSHSCERGTGRNVTLVDCLMWICTTVGNPFAKDCDGQGRSHRYYTIRLLPTVTAVDGLVVDDHEAANVIAFINSLKASEKEKLESQSNFRLVRDQVVIGVMAHGLGATLERVSRGLFESERRGRCVCCT